MQCSLTRAFKAALPTPSQVSARLCCRSSARRSHHIRRNTVHTKASTTSVFKAEFHPAEADPSCSDGEQSDTEYCLPAFVTVDNEKEEGSTVLDVEVRDYPGLLRIIAWVLNGMDLIAQNAVVHTDSEGNAHNTFWVTSLNGKKLKDSTAEMLADRVRDYLLLCVTASSKTQNATEFTSGHISISNSEDEDSSVITVREKQPTPGFLLQIASALAGLNVQIQQGVIQGTGKCADQPHRLRCDSRVFKFWIRTGDGNKLGFEQIGSLLFTLNVVLGYHQNPLTPPDSELLATTNSND